jgi:hypothetical protein
MQQHANINPSTTSPSNLTEIAGIAIGATFLLSVFENAIACFMCFKLAKSFGPDLQLYMVRLEVLHLRLIRWREVAGFSEEPTSKPHKGNGIPIAQLLLLFERHFEEAARAVQDLDVGDDIVTVEKVVR